MKLQKPFLIIALIFGTSIVIPVLSSTVKLLHYPTQVQRNKDDINRIFVKPIHPPHLFYMQHYYNPFWYGGPLDGGEPFNGPYGGFAPNPFARPTSPPKPGSNSSSESTES